MVATSGRTQGRKDVATLQLPADHHPTGSINAMNLKD